MPLNPWTHFNAATTTISSKVVNVSVNCKIDTDCGLGCCSTVETCRCYVGADFSGPNGTCFGFYCKKICFSNSFIIHLFICFNLIKLNDKYFH